MKRNTLTTAVVAGLTGMAGMVSVSNAVNVNPDGIGQVLLYPYYTARGGNDTLISIVNTTERGKAVKVRFLEGMNSREVLDFNLYLSPYDVWTAAITEGADGGGELRTSDNSCTVPYLFGDRDGVQPFLDFEYTGFPIGTNYDGGPQGIERTASGYVEVIEMGTMVEGDFNPRTDPPGVIVRGENVEYYSKHVNGVPRNCQALVNAWTESETFTSESKGAWLQPGGSQTGFDRMTGGLLGSASIVNVTKGTMFSYNATAIDGFASEQNTLHFEPGNIRPDLSNGDVKTSITFNNGTLEEIEWQYPVEAVSSALAIDAVFNQYDVQDSLAANTEWVMTFPTRRFYVDAFNPAQGTNAGAKDFIPFGVEPGEAALPFTQTWHYSILSSGAIRPTFGCETLSFKFWDREENQPETISGPVVSPKPPGGPSSFRLCRESNVVRFSDSADVPAATEIFGEPLREGTFGRLSYVNFQIPYGAGWATFNFSPDNKSRPAVDPAGRVVNGLPMIGFAATTYTNSNIEAGVLANYGGTFVHKGSRSFAASAN